MSEALTYFLFDDDVTHRLNRGVDFMLENHFAKAIAEFDYVLKLDPSERYARWNRCLALLSLGDYVKGFPEHDSAWALYDWRSLGPVKGNIDRVLELPVWKGERCKLITYHEMGFGDAIMALRFLPELVKRCESVTLVVRNELVSLFQGYGATVVGDVPIDVSGFDARVTFFNSIFTMGYTLETIPSAPYIKSDFKFSGGRMGITWCGNSRREMTLPIFMSLLDTRNFELYALQKTELYELQKFGLDDYDIIQLGCKNFKETAELMMSLDCIVTIDTATAHLAGAIGHPNTHLITPFFRDWRWWNKDVWYPTINIYSQDSYGDWTKPFERLNAALKAA